MYSDHEKHLKFIDKNHLKKQSNTNDLESSFSLLYIKASVIRLYLYSIITKTPIYFEDYYILAKKVLYDILPYDENIKSRFRSIIIKVTGNQNINIHKDIEDSLKISLKDVRDIYCMNDTLYEKHVEYCNNESIISKGSIQKIIDGLYFSLNNYSTFDYAQNFIGNQSNKYTELSGERFIIYKSMKQIYLDNQGNKRIAALLYAYLLIKNKIRAELVQCNPLIGFYNFKNYQYRKDWFIPWSPKSEQILTIATIQSILDDSPIFRVELRIGPSNKLSDLQYMIKLYDNAIDSAIKNHELKEKVNKEQFFYTIHFFKTKDTQNKKLVCRDYDLRQKILNQVNILLSFRKYNPTLAKRILGIDACSEEMNCRPEVFGSVFRLLQFYDTQNSYCPQLKTTYHVGEDNYDILDALIAIDETILFLELQNGSRLGHATLLGIPPEFYYKKKGYCVSMPYQVFLDNIVWLYFFLKKIK